ncbi:MAG: TIGR03087 family PEP-CTERM/XrtA system glycosyltransferase [Woeseiaceae bacterium]|nr:TIGR03087 family PEP-CTERM/XrtA system glycosyltransferase [Woeseiaceae bacterium]
MKDLLYLAHRIPYPPNKGDKIRSYHLLQRLAEKWNVHLGAFVDDPDDWQHVSVLQDICAETCFVGLNPSWAKVRALRGFLTGTSLTMPYYRKSELGDWVASLADSRHIEAVVVFSSSMAQHAESLLGGDTRSVIDFCDMDSDKWHQYSQKFGGIRRWIYGREAARLRDEETAIARKFDASVLISDDETRIFCEQTGTPPERVHVVRNGVDLEYFDPGQPFNSPYREDEKPLVFVGAMDYWPNIDAVKWFADHVFPAVREVRGDANFYVVGSNPGREVLELGEREGITVTGRVEDVRPYLAFSLCAVAPLRVARGVQNKVLEAMAMARPVLASDAALEGISFTDDSGITVCNAESAWTDALVTALDKTSVNATVSGARRHVSEQYSWDASVQSLVDIIEAAG